MSNTDVDREVVNREQSNPRLRVWIESHPDLAAIASLLFGIAAALVFVGAADQVDLGAVVLRTLVGTFLGGCSLLTLHELMANELEIRDGKVPEKRSAVARRLFCVLSKWRWVCFAVLVVLIAVGLRGATVPSVRDVVAVTVFGQSLAALAAVAGVAVLAGWALVLFLELERGVLVAPNVWLYGGLVVAFGGAVLGGVTSGAVRTVGVMLAVAGLIGVKMAVPAILDQIDPGSRIVRDPKAMAADRRVRAAEVTAAGVVGAVAGTLLMKVGANVNRSAYLTVGLLAVVGGLSLVGIGAPRLILPLRRDERFDDNRLRLITTALVVTGALLSVWGATRTVEAAGDWFMVVVVICVLLLGTGAWFTYRGEALIMLALIVFLLPWVMKDRSTVDPATLNVSGASDVLAFSDLTVGDGIVVALGDSFMSGEGADDYFRGTNTPASNQCRRAPTAYAVTVAQHLNRELRFLACSGATTRHVRLDGAAQMNRSPDDIAGARPQLLALRHELEAARSAGRDPKVDLVLVSIGGNDTGFSKIIQACLLPTNCAENADFWIAKAESLKEDLTDTYSQVRNVVGREVPIVVVPYPRFIEPRACDRLASQAEFEFVVDFIEALNNTILRAANDANILVANTSDQFESQKQCDPDPAVNLITLAPPSGDSVLDRLGPGNWIHNSMHPKLGGHANQAEVLVPLATALVEACGDGVDCRPQCELDNVEVIQELQGIDVGLRKPLLLTNCDPPAPTTPEELAAERTASADQLLDTVVNEELYNSAGLLITPFLALLSGGLMMAIGLTGRPKTAGLMARFLSPIVPLVPEVRLADRDVHLIGLSATTDEATVLAVAPRSNDDPPPELVLSVAHRNGRPTAARIAVGPWHYVEAGRNPYFWTKAIISELEAGTSYTAHGANGVRAATVATLPETDRSKLSLVVGSCFYRGSHISENLAEAYQVLIDGDDRLEADGFDGPIYHFWLGDQVYLDVPWKTGFRTVDILDQVAKRYLDNWEIGTATPDPEDSRRGPTQRRPDQRFGRVLRSSSNWFLPDDHEFWNGYPKVSYRSLPRHAVKRRLKNLRAEAGHPYGHGEFGQAAGDAYLVFQSPKTADPATGRFDQDGEPTRPDPIQEIVLSKRDDGPAARIILADTRWGRTISTGSNGRFMAAEDLDDLLDRLQPPGLVILMLSRPLAGYPAKGRRLGQEQVTENYQGQYRRLLSAIADRVKAGHPTIIVAGDVHDSSMYSVAEGRLVQIVSSPIVMEGEASANEDPFKFDELDDLVALGDGERPADFRDILPDLDGSTGGLVRLDVDVDDPAWPVIHYRYRSLDPNADEQRCELRWIAGDTHSRWDRAINEPGHPVTE